MMIVIGGWINVENGQFLRVLRVKARGLEVTHRAGLLAASVAGGFYRRKDLGGRFFLHFGAGYQDY